MKTLQGTVVSLKTANTAKVSVQHSWTHPLYKKSVKRNKNYACHYDAIELKEGDRVLIKESRPLSKTKRFIIDQKIEKGSI